MSDEYRRQIETLIDDARLPADCDISYKNVFGAVAAYANGKIFMTCGKFGLALKLPDDTCGSLMAEGAGEPLRYFAKGHIKRNYVVLLAGALEDEARAAKLVRQSAAFVQAG